jgi:hypothetical protein
MKKTVIAQIQRQIKNVVQLPQTEFQRGTVNGLNTALKIVENAKETVALTPNQKAVFTFYESHGVFDAIRKGKSEGISTYRICQMLNRDKVPTFQSKTWNQTQVQRVIVMMKQLGLNNDSTTSGVHNNKLE